MASFRVTLRDSASWCKGRGLVFRKGVPASVPEGPVLDAVRASNLFSIIELKSSAPAEPLPPAPKPPEVTEPEPADEPEPEPVTEPEDNPKPKQLRKGKKKG